MDRDGWRAEGAHPLDPALLLGENAVFQARLGYGSKEQSTGCVWVDAPWAGAVGVAVMLLALRCYRRRGRPICSAARTGRVSLSVCGAKQSLSLQAW